MEAGPMPSPPRVDEPSRPDEWAARERKGLAASIVAALFDVNFDRLLAPQLIKLVYVIFLVLTVAWGLVSVSIGLWIATWDDWWAWGLIMVAATPLSCLLGLLVFRLLLESIVVRFKQAEHLRAIKDKI
jgi:hypothetical protein